MVKSRPAKLRQGDAESTELKTVDPSEFTYVLIAAVKQQQRTIETQEARIAALERRGAPMASSITSGGLAGWATLALLPIGLLIARGKRRDRS
jgi:hypothetical protein